MALFDISCKFLQAGTLHYERLTVKLLVDQNLLSRLIMMLIEGVSHLQMNTRETLL